MKETSSGLSPARLPPDGTEVQIRSAGGSRTAFPAALTPIPSNVSVCRMPGRRDDAGLPARPRHVHLPQLIRGLEQRPLAPDLPGAAQQPADVAQRPAEE